MSPDFSIIIPSRNRPQLLRQAIESVLRQSHKAIELIVVDDGSDGENAVHYARMAEDYRGRVRVLHLIHRPRGHGAAYAINYGASQAQGRYLGFLDDDDVWIDDDHLACADQILRSAQSDLYFTNQEAVIDGAKVNRTIWIEDLAAMVRQDPNPGPFGSYPVTIADLLRCTGFAHTNTTIISRSLFDEIGGMDENNRYESDRDFYLRAIDRAERIAYRPAVISRHHIPDPSKSANISTRLTNIQKWLNQVGLLDKSALSARSPAIRAYCLTHKVYALKKIAHELWSQGQFKLASHYAREAILIGFSFKWLGVTAYLSLRGWSSAK